MTEDKKLLPIKLPAFLRNELKREAHARFAAGLPEPTYGDLLAEAWELFKAQKSIAKSGSAAPTENSEPNPSQKSGDSPESPMIVSVPNRSTSERKGTETTWEHRAVDRILATAYAEAFRVNIRAVHLFAVGSEPDEGTTDPDAGPQPVSGGKMEEIDSRIGTYEQALDVEEKDIRRPRPGRSGGRRPKDGTS